MPRGSKPGERRGGRQKGTPNKKTLLRNAAITAAAADPNLRPLDCLLSVMQDDSLALETRVAAAREAFPYCHAKRPEPKPPPNRRNRFLYPTTPEVKTSEKSSTNTIESTLSTSHEASRGASVSPADQAAEGMITPIEYLLSVMRDPHTPAPLRMRIAAFLARFVHPRHDAKEAEHSDREEQEAKEFLGRNSLDTLKNPIKCGRAQRTA